MSSPNLDTRGEVGTSLHTMSPKTPIFGPVKGGPIVELRAKKDDMELALLFDRLGKYSA